MARYYEEYDDDEEVADYYFSSAAGRARVVIGNRRNGPNGFISSGRMQARPIVAPASRAKVAFILLQHHCPKRRVFVPSLANCLKRLNSFWSRAHQS